MILDFLRLKGNPKPKKVQVMLLITCWSDAEMKQMNGIAWLEKNFG